MDSTVPAELTAGDTWEWERDLADYPAPTWTLAYNLKNECGAIGPISSTPNGSKHQITVAAATTADYEPGRYRYYVRATAGTVSKTIEEGWVVVKADPADAGALDARSLSQKTLDALNARIHGRATQDQMSMSVNGRSISRIPLPELLQLRDTLQAEVKAEDDAASKGAGRDIKVRLRRG